MRACVCLIGALLISGSTYGICVGAPLDWEVGRADCQYLTRSHEKIREADPKFASVEALEVRAGNGSRIYAQRRVDPSLIIEDLTVRVWIRSDRRGIQVLGRIVLPNSLDPQSGLPDTLLVPGEIYQSQGQWRELTLTKTPKHFRDRLRVLRARVERPVDPRGAYLEAVVLNVYGGPGTTQIWIGDMSMQGAIRPLEPLPTRDGPATAAQRRISAGPELRVSRLSVDGKPFFPRIIDHRGEPFELLERLGFNTIHLPQLPSPEQQDEARRLGLWLVCPPPGEINKGLSNYPAVLAWHFGDDVSTQAGVRRRVDALRRHDSRNRVLVGGASEFQWIASRQVDVLLRDRAPLGTSFALSDYGKWLDQTSRLVRPGTPFWARIQTELPASIVQQASLLATPPHNASARVELEQIRQLALAALAAGSRGLWFRSDNPLDAQHEDAQHRRLILERLNLELAMFAPWAMGGHRVGEVQGNNPRRRIVALTTERSRLLIPTQHHRHGQYVSSASKEKSTMVVAGVPDSSGVYLLSPIGLLRLPHRRISGGIEIVVDHADCDTAILMTESGLDASHLHQLIDKTKTRAAILEYRIARRALEELVEQSKANLESVLSQQGISQAQDHLQHCQRLLETGDVTDVFKSAQEARHAVARVRHGIWKDAVRLPLERLSEPTTVAFHLLSASDEPAPATRQYLWPGGDCENLTQMIRMGWRQQQSASPDLDTYVALSPEQPKGGDHCLRIRVVPRSQEAADVVVESPPIWIDSAAIDVRKGQRIRVAGWVRIDQPIKGSLDGLMISDSIGGPELALRLKQTDGWQSFEMIRAADQDDQLVLRFSLSGIGEVWLDDLRVTPADPSQVARRNR